MPFCKYAIEILVPAALDVLENLPNQLFLDNGNALKVVIEVCKPKCFYCRLKEHLCASCKPKKTEVEVELEKIFQTGSR